MKVDSTWSNSLSVTAGAGGAGAIAKIVGIQGYKMRVPPGTSMTLRINLQNVGNASGDLAWRLRFGDIYRGSSTKTVAPGGVAYWDTTVTAPTKAGEYYITIEAGHIEAGEFVVDETKKYIVIIITPKAKVVSVKYPTSVRAGEPFDLTVTLMNDSEVEGKLAFRLSIDGEIVRGSSVKTVPAKGSASWTYEITIGKEGKYTVKVEGGHIE